MTEKNQQDVGEVLTRIEQALGAGRWMSALEVQPETVRTWRKRGAVPLTQLQRVAQMSGKTVDWLLKGPSFFAGKEIQISQAATVQEKTKSWGDADSAFDVAALVLELIEERGLRLPPSKVVELMRLVYDYKRSKVDESMEALRDRTAQILRLVA